MENNKKRQALQIVISVLVAFGLWLYVDQVNGIRVTITVDDIPVEFIGEETTLADRGLMLLSDSRDASITLRLKAERGVIAKMDPEEIRIVADLSNITSVGKQTVTCRTIFPSGINSNQVSVEYASASSVTVNVGELYKKAVEIRCERRGTVADGYLAGEVSFQPAALEIRGQQASVERVSYAKVVLNVDNATETVVQDLTFQLYDYQDRLVEDADIHAMSDTIRVTMPVQIIKELPLNISFEESPGSSADNVDYDIFPASIKVCGDPAVLESVDSMLLGTITLAELDNMGTYHYPIMLPEGCQNLSGETTATVVVSFKDIDTTTVIVDNIQLENGPEDKLATVLTAEVEVTLRGRSEDLAAIRPEDIRVVGDLTDVATADGSYTVPAEVFVDTSLDVGILGTYQIQVTISQAEEETE